MRKNTAISNLIWMAAALIFGAAIAGSAAQPQKQAPAVNASCLACHQASSLQGSVHSSLSCADCHRIPAAGATKEVPHAPKKDIPLVDCTAKCHGDDARTQQPGQSPSSYADSVHGKGYLERGEMDVAKCWDCHGKHNIKPVQAPDSVVNRRNIPLVCSHCHENMNVVLKYNIHAESPYQEYMQSVHGKALFEKGLVTFAAVCTDCHGVHDVKAAGDPQSRVSRKFIIHTCGGCHVGIEKNYLEGVHGKDYIKGVKDVPVCTDCHSEHGILSPQDLSSRVYATKVAAVCSRCHDDERLARQYGFLTSRLKTYSDSYHGTASKFGETRVANCASCHGFHDIRTSSDPKSPINAVNLSKTCGKYHPGAGTNFAKGKVHVVSTKVENKGAYAAKVFYIIVIAALISVFLIFIAADLFHRIRTQWKND
jgi:predicted CXXCH cytochrome family protein